MKVRATLENRQRDFTEVENIAELIDAADEDAADPDDPEAGRGAAGRRWRVRPPGRPSRRWRAPPPSPGPPARAARRGQEEADR